MKDGSYVVIQSFMVNDLHLKGNELIVYATIFGFSQDGAHWFYGTRGYLAEWCGAKRETVDRCLRSLLEKGYIERKDVEEHGRVSVQYRATKNVQGTQFFSTPPSKTGTPTPKIEHINKIEQPKDKKENIWRGPRKPTLQEVSEYVAEKGYHFDPQHFFDYYEASGWKMQSGKPVKSWRQCCVTWERNWRKNESTDRRDRYTEQQNDEFDSYGWTPDQITYM